MDVTPQGAGFDDPESSDAAPIGPTSTDDASTDTVLDVTPRTGPEDRRTGRNARRRRTVAGVAVLALIVLALGAVLFNGLRDASMFFYNVDEAEALHDELTGERFRMQGNVVPGSVRETSDGVEFALRFNGVTVPVVNHGEPPELFGPKIPVVLGGTFRGERFESDEILIRHDSSYDEENPDRVRDAEKDANA